ncbi:MAG: hypothetical protein K5637_02380 [Lachnospiraceae bacterium]|nr:hypothetical protein [Lachnospiraceae bacterium]
MSEDNKEIKSSGSDEKKTRPKFPVAIIVGAVLIVISKTVDFGQFHQFISIMMLLVGCILVAFVGYRYILDLLGAEIHDFNPEMLNRASFAARRKIGETLGGREDVEEEPDIEEDPADETSPFDIPEDMDKAFLKTESGESSGTGSRNKKLMQEREIAIQSQSDPDRYKRICLFPCPYCGHYSLREMTGEEQEGSGGIYVCGKCGRTSK